MASARPDVRIREDPAAVFQAAAVVFAEGATAAAGARGAFAVALAGGSTPRGLYELLAGEGKGGFRGRVPWARTHVFWGDERAVPPDHPDSNYRMAREALLDKVPVPPSHIHRIQAERGVAAAAAAYAQVLQDHFGVADGQVPRLDLVLLGMGADGHTASLFPGAFDIHETRRLVLAPWVEKLQTHRVTLAPAVLNAAGCVLFLVSGADKAATLRAVLRGPEQPECLPAQLVRPAHGELIWLVDRPAARLL